MPVLLVGVATADLARVLAAAAIYEAQCQGDFGAVLEATVVLEEMGGLAAMSESFRRLDLQLGERRRRG